MRLKPVVGNRSRAADSKCFLVFMVSVQLRRQRHGDSHLNLQCSTLQFIKNGLKFDLPDVFVWERSELVNEATRGHSSTSLIVLL